MHWLQFFFNYEPALSTDLQGGNECNQHRWKQSSGIIARCILGSNSLWSMLFWIPFTACGLKQICRWHNNTLTVNKMCCFSPSVVIRLDKVSEIDYALLKAPEFTSTYVETQHKVTWNHISLTSCMYMLVYPWHILSTLYWHTYCCTVMHYYHVLYMYSGKLSCMHGSTVKRD